MSIDKNKVFGPLELPTGKKIKFRAALGSDRMNVIQMLKIDSDAVVSGALMIDDYVKAKCVVEVDGKEVQENYKELLNNWLDTDISFYKLVFDKMFNNQKEMEAKAEKAVAFLLNSQDSSDGFNVQN